jgi:hypothetical protein
VERIDPSHLPRFPFIGRFGHQHLELDILSLASLIFFRSIMDQGEISGEMRSKERKVRKERGKLRKRREEKVLYFIFPHLNPPCPLPVLLNLVRFCSFCSFYSF